MSGTASHAGSGCRPLWTTSGDHPAIATTYCRQTAQLRRLREESEAVGAEVAEPSSAQSAGPHAPSRRELELRQAVERIRQVIEELERVRRMATAAETAAYRSLSRMIREIIDRP